VGFEYLLLDRPLVRIEMPELINRTRVPREYVDLMASASITVRGVGEALGQVEQAFADPQRQSQTRCQVAAELFYGPGGATGRALRELYDLLELTVPDVGDSGDASRGGRLLATGTEAS
jgi:hypothetical protein